MSPTTNPPSDDAGTPVSRRRVLATAGAGLLGLGSGMVGTARGRPSTAVVSSPSGARRLLDAVDALRTREVRRLRRELIADGYRPRIRDAIVHRSTPEQGPAYRTVAIPFERGRDGAEAVVLWTDDGPFPVQARRFVPESNRQVKMRTRQLDGGTALDTTTTISPEFWWWFCWDLDWGCVLSVAGAWAGSIGACAACVADPSKITCISCVAAVLSAAGATLSCDWCD